MFEQIITSVGVMALTLFLAVTLSATVEAIVEFFVSPIFDKSLKLVKYKWTMMYIPIVPAVFLAIYYKIDLISFLANSFLALLSGDGTAEIAVASSLVGFIITGLLMARGSNFVHQFVKDRLTDKTTAGRYAAE